jgi:hypothetical protein
MTSRAGLRPLCASSSLTTTTATAATYQTGSPLRQNRRRHGRARMDARTRPTAEPAPHFFQPSRKIFYYFFETLSEEVR